MIKFTLISLILFSFLLGFAESSEFLTIDSKTILNISDMESFSGDAIGYKIINIGDLDDNGTEDLATIAFLSNYNYTKDDDSDNSKNYGAVQILFMNDSGNVLNTKRITMDNEENGLGTACLDDPKRGSSFDDILGRTPQSLESITFLGNFINNNPTLAIGYPNGDFIDDESNSGDVLLVELANTGDILSCNKLTQISGFSNEYLPSKESSFGTPIFTSDVNSDGYLDLVVGKNGTFVDIDNEGDGTDLLFFLFNEKQTISQTSVIEGITLGLTKFDMGLESGHSLDGQKKIVVSSGDEKGGDSLLIIINLNDDQSVETRNTLSESHFDFFGFTIDMKANSPYEHNQFFDSTDDSDGSSDAFGYEVYSPGDLDGDQIEDIIVSAFNDDEPMTNAGSIYFLLMNSEDYPKDVYKLSNSNLSSNDSFGHSIASFQSNDKTWLAVGAPFDDTDGTDSGVIYIYDFEDFPFFPIIDNGDGESIPAIVSAGNNEPISNLKSNPVLAENKTETDTRIWLTTKDKFAAGFNHLISEGDIQGKRISSLNDIPEWIMTFLGEKWYDEEISDTVYYRALEYLYNNKIIQ
ncbi:MAG: hypothetical protein V3U87_15860 [Methylococcaceae bacterium]